MKPNLRCKRKAMSGLEGPLETVGLKMITAGIRYGRHSKSWRERVPDYKS